MNALKARSYVLGALMWLVAAGAARADVITDWCEKAVPVAAAHGAAPAGLRTMAMVHLAMFEAVNAIDPRYASYKFKLEAPRNASREAAAAAAAASVLMKMFPDARQAVQTELMKYLLAIPDGEAKAAGIAVGEKAAEAIIALRAKDGADAPDIYRPRTTAGRYVPTAAVITPMYATITPFALQSPSQFRPKAPLALKSREWASNFNEVRELGGKNSSKRSASQTETARFWFATGPVVVFPPAIQLSKAKNLDLSENARLLALFAMAGADSLIAVMDAKYHYEFWRPVTAIRNGDADDNPLTERQADWEPLGATPMHPEYPCAHCISVSAGGAVLQAFFGKDSVPEFSMTSPTAPGVVHRWSRVQDLIDETSNARVWAGIHYRFSTKAGEEMGRQIGEYVLQNYLLPLN
jgi:hypothetical protein